MTKIDDLLGKIVSVGNKFLPNNPINKLTKLNNTLKNNTTLQNVQKIDPTVWQDTNGNQVSVVDAIKNTSASNLLTGKINATPSVNQAKFNNIYSNVQDKVASTSPSNGKQNFYGKLATAINSNQQQESMLNSLQKAFYNTDGTLTREEINQWINDSGIKKTFPKVNADDILSLQSDITPILKQSGQFVDNAQIAEKYPNLYTKKNIEELTQKSRDAQNRWQELVNKVSKANPNVLSDAGKSLYNFIQDSKRIPEQIRGQYNVSSDVTDAELVSTVWANDETWKERYEMVKRKKSKMNSEDRSQLGLSSKFESFVNDLFKGMFINPVLANTSFNQGVNALKNAWEENVQPFIDRGRQENPGTFDWIGRGTNAVADVASMPGNLLSGISKISNNATNLTSLNPNKSLKENFNEETGELIKLGGGTIETLFNSALAPATALFHVAGEVPVAGDILNWGFGLIPNAVDYILSGKWRGNNIGATSGENQKLPVESWISDWYNNGLDDEARQDLQNEVFLLVAHKISKSDRLKKLGADSTAFGKTLIEAIQDAIQTGRYATSLDLWLKRQQRGGNVYEERYGLPGGEDGNPPRGGATIVDTGEFKEGKNTFGDIVDSAKTGIQAGLGRFVDNLKTGSEFNRRLDQRLNKITADREKAKVTEGVKEEVGDLENEIRRGNNIGGQLADLQTKVDENVRNEEIAKGLRKPTTSFDSIKEKFTGLDDATREQIKKNPFATDEVRRIVEALENDEGLDFGEYEIGRYQEALNTIIKKIDEIETKRTEDIGPLYQLLEQINTPVDTSNLLGDLSSFVRDLSENISSGERNKINEILDRVREGNIDNISALWELRKLADKYSNWEANSTTEGINAIRGIRDRIDSIIRDQVPEFKEVDSSYVQVLKDLQDLRGKLYTKKNGRFQLRDNAVSTVKNLLNPSNRLYLERLEKHIPGLTQYLQGLKQIKKVYNAYTTGNGSRFISGIAQAIGGKIGRIVGALAGGAGGFFLGALADGTIDTFMKNFTKKAIKDTLTKMTSEGIKELQRIADKVKAGKELTKAEKARLKELSKKIIEEGKRRAETKAEKEYWEKVERAQQKFNESVESDNRKNKLTDQRKPGDKGKTEVTGDATNIVVDEEGNARRKGQIGESDKRSEENKKNGYINKEQEAIKKVEGAMNRLEAGLKNIGDKIPDEYQKKQLVKDVNNLQETIHEVEGDGYKVPIELEREIADLTKRGALKSIETPKKPKNTITGTKTAVIDKAKTPQKTAENIVNEAKAVEENKQLPTTKTAVTSTKKTKKGLTNVQKFREETEKYYPNYKEVESDALYKAQDILDYYDIPAEIVDLVFTGSLSRGLQHNTSDTDILIELKGKKGERIREDNLFDILNDGDLNDGEFDFNPIVADDSGTLEDVIVEHEQHLKQKELFKNELDKIGVEWNKETADDTVIISKRMQDLFINFLKRTDGPVNVWKDGKGWRASAHDKGAGEYQVFTIGADADSPAEKRLLDKIQEARKNQKIEIGKVKGDDEDEEEQENKTAITGNKTAVKDQGQKIKPQLEQGEVKGEMYHVTPEDFEKFKEENTYNDIDWNTAFGTFVTDSKPFLDSFKEVSEDTRRKGINGWNTKVLNVDAKKVILHPADIAKVFGYGKESESILIDYLKTVGRWNIEEQKNLVGLKMLDTGEWYDIDYDTYPRKDSYTKEEILEMPGNVFGGILQDKFEGGEVGDTMWSNSAEADAKKLRELGYDAVMFYEGDINGESVFSYALFHPNKYLENKETASSTSGQYENAIGLKKQKNSSRINVFSNVIKKIIDKYASNIADWQDYGDGKLGYIIKLGENYLPLEITYGLKDKRLIVRHYTPEGYDDPAMLFQVTNEGGLKAIGIKQAFMEQYYNQWGWSSLSNTDEMLHVRAVNLEDQYLGTNTIDEDTGEVKEPKTASEVTKSNNAVTQVKAPENKTKVTSSKDEATIVPKAINNIDDFKREIIDKRDTDRKIAMFNRMLSDINYIVNNNLGKAGYRHLRATGNPEKHIQYMKALLDSIPEEDSPDVDMEGLENRLMNVSDTPITSTKTAVTAPKKQKGKTAKELLEDIVKKRKDVDMYNFDDEDSEGGGRNSKKFLNFAKELKKAYQAIANENNMELVNYSVGYYYVSTFFKDKNTNSYYWTSTNDTRDREWWKGQVYRTAENEKDFRGGSNHFTDLVDLGESLQKLQRIDNAQKNNITSNNKNVLTSNNNTNEGSKTNSGEEHEGQSELSNTSKTILTNDGGTKVTADSGVVSTSAKTMNTSSDSSSKSGAGSRAGGSNVKIWEKGNDAITSKTVTQARDINRECVSILEKHNYSNNPKDYTEDEINTLKQYEGRGGVNDKQDSKTQGALNQYYTKDNIIKAMWRLVDGYDNKDILEPSMGVGRFFMYAPENANLFGFEYDKIPGTIAQILYPNADIKIMDFQDNFMVGKYSVGENYRGRKYDLIIGNPPYEERQGRQRGLGEEPKINRFDDYFIKRGIDMLKPGGHLIFVTSSQFLRGADNYAKQKISENAQLIDAYRIPIGAFDRTGVETDIVLFEKNENGGDKSLLSASKWFIEHPDKILGEEQDVEGRYGTKKGVVGDISAIDNIASTRVVTTDGEPATIEQTFTPTEKVEKQEPVTTKTIEAKKENKPKKTFNKSEWQDWVETRVNDDGTQETITLGKSLNGVVFKGNGGKTGTLVVGKGGIGKYQKLLNANGKIGDPDIKLSDDREGLNYIKGELEPNILYASGHIPTKLEQLEKDYKGGFIDEWQYNKQKDLLEQAKPEEIGFQDIYFSPYIDWLLDFDTNEITTVRTREGMKDVKSSIRSVFKKYINERINSYRIINYKNSKGETQTANAGYVMLDILNKGKEFPTSAKERVATLYPNEFNSFMKGYTLDSDTKSRIQKTYNDLYNSYANFDYSGLGLTVEDISKTFRGNDFALSDVQSRGIARILTTEAMIIAHGVGQGKTIEGIIGAIASMQQGKARKALIIIPAGTKSGWMQTVAQLFPNQEMVDLGSLAKGIGIRKKLVDMFGPDPRDWIQDGQIVFLEHSAIGRQISFKNDTLTELEQNLTDVMESNFEVEKNIDEAKKKLEAQEKALEKAQQKGASASDIEKKQKNMENLIASIEQMGGKTENPLQDIINTYKDQGANEDIITEAVSTIDKDYDEYIHDMEAFIDNQINVGQAQIDKEKALKVVNDIFTNERAIYLEDLGIDHMTVDEAHNFRNLFNKAIQDDDDGGSYHAGTNVKEGSKQAKNLYAMSQYIMGKNGGGNVVLLTATPFINDPSEMYNMLSYVGKNGLVEMGVENIDSFYDNFVGLENRMSPTASTSGVEYKNVMVGFNNTETLVKNLLDRYVDYEGESLNIVKPRLVTNVIRLNMSTVQKKIETLLEEQIDSGEYKDEWEGVSLGKTRKTNDAGKELGAVLEGMQQANLNLISPYLTKYLKDQLATLTWQDMIDTSPKLKAVIDIIKLQRDMGIFRGTFVYMEQGKELQELLKKAIEESIPGTKVGIINGDKKYSDLTEAQAKKLGVGAKGAKARLTAKQFHDGEIDVLIGGANTKEGIELQGNGYHLIEVSQPWNMNDRIQLNGRMWRQGNLSNEVLDTLLLMNDSSDIYRFELMARKEARWNILEMLSAYKRGEKIEDVKVDGELDMNEEKLALFTDPEKKAKVSIVIEESELKEEESQINGQKATIEKLINIMSNWGNDYGWYRKLGQGVGNMDKLYDENNKAVTTNILDENALEPLEQQLQYARDEAMKDMVKVKERWGENWTKAEMEKRIRNNDPYSYSAFRRDEINNKLRQARSERNLVIRQTNALGMNSIEELNDYLKSLEEKSEVIKEKISKIQDTFNEKVAYFKDLQAKNKEFELDDESILKDLAEDFKHQVTLPNKEALRNWIELTKDLPKREQARTKTAITGGKNKYTWKSEDYVGKKATFEKPKNLITSQFKEYSNEYQKPEIKYIGYVPKEIVKTKDGKTLTRIGFQDQFFSMNYKLREIKRKYTQKENEKPSWKRDDINEILNRDEYYQSLKTRLSNMILKFAQRFDDEIIKAFKKDNPGITNPTVEDFYNYINDYHVAGDDVVKIDDEYVKQGAEYLLEKFNNSGNLKNSLTSNGKNKLTNL